MTAQQLALVLVRWAGALLVVLGAFGISAEIPIFAEWIDLRASNAGAPQFMAYSGYQAISTSVPFVVGLFALIFARRIARLLSRGCHPEGHCQRCGYLPPPAATACPECGYRRRAGAVGDMATTPPPASSTGA
jgi:hypothetical protein